MSLYDILVCSICKTSLDRSGDALHCARCGRTYPILNNVPIMLPDWDGSNIVHEGDLQVRQGYDPWVHRMIMQSLPDDQVVVDCGCGNMALDDPCIVRMDVTLTPYVDLVADVHALPFKPDSLAFIFAMAVFEHLRQPFTAAEEMYAALKPGGYVYAECNFIFAYHGFPHHYFNASVQGMQQLFTRFRQQLVGVAPFQMPSFALHNLLSNYLAFFQPTTPDEARFAALLEKAMRYPLRSYDAKFGLDVAFRIAAGDYFLGLKQPKGDETVIPALVMEHYHKAPELQARFPDPYHLALPDNLMTWARTTGAGQHVDLARYFSRLTPFSKYADESRSLERTTIRRLPPIPHPDEQRFIAEPEPPAPRSWWEQLADALRRPPHHP